MDIYKCPKMKNSNILPKKNLMCDDNEKLASPDQKNNFTNVSIRKILFCSESI